MNKSILKHEFRNMKWMLLLSILVSVFLTVRFGISLDRDYAIMFSSGIYANDALVLNAFRNLSEFILVVFTGLTIIQIFMQFRSEKNQETGRFLKSLPVKKEEFFKIKLITGLINITLAFIVLVIGIIIVRKSNMFWIKDTYSISYISEILMKSDSVIILLKEMGLIYLVVLSFYTFLFMIQYTFSNVVGGIVIGVLVWLAPIFIVTSSMYTLSRIGFVEIYNSNIVSSIDNLSMWLLPWIYVFDFGYNVLPYGMDPGRVRIIANIGIKYIISLAIIIVNIIGAYKFNQGSKVENENKIIPFKSTQAIFKLGVTLCSGLLVSTILGDVMMMEIPSIVYMILILLGTFIGYFVSRKIANVGNV